MDPKSRKLNMDPKSRKLNTTKPHIKPYTAIKAKCVRKSQVYIVFVSFRIMVSFSSPLEPLSLITACSLLA